MPRPRILGTVATLALVVAACSSSPTASDAPAETRSSATTPDPTTVEATTPDNATPDTAAPDTSTLDTSTLDTATADTADTGDTVPGDALTAKQVIAAVSPSVVFLENEYATGTGLAIEGGYILTNAHVVTPFATVDVTPPSGTTIEDVPVVGINFAADIAVIGPLDEPLPPIQPGAADELEGGDDVYLIGYPSETEESPTPTISEGIVSRIREVEEFDQTYIQTDADIAGGQSGGALVNGRGEVVGISGESLDEAFALALTIDDALARADDVRTNHGDEWTPLPEDGALTGDIAIPGLMFGATADMLPADHKEAVSLTLTGDPAVVYATGIFVFLDDGTTYFSRNALPLAAEQAGVDLEELEKQIPEDLVLDPGPDGAYTFDVPADQRGTIQFMRLDVDEPATIQFTSTRQLAVIPDGDDGATIEVGDEVDGIIEPLESQDIYLIQLDAGDEIEITVTTGSSDAAFVVLAPDERFGNDTFYIDDSDVGIGGLDAQDTYTATAAGIHRIVVSDNFGQGGYHLKVAAG